MIQSTHIIIERDWFILANKEFKVQVDWCGYKLKSLCQNSEQPVMELTFEQFA